jgi:hypothetical protein
LLNQIELPISYGLLCLQDMARLQEKGEAAEAELRALEMDLTGKVNTPTVFLGVFHPSTWYRPLKRAYRYCLHPGEAPDGKLARFCAKYATRSWRKLEYPRRIYS